MKIRLQDSETVAFFLIVLFPIVFMFFNIVGKNQGLRVFYFIYAGTLTALFSGKKLLVKKDVVFLSLLIIIKLLYDIFAYPDSISDSITVAFLYLLLLVFSEENRSSRFGEYVVKISRYIFYFYIFYLLGLIYTILFGNGLVHRWGTISLYGHYNMAHLLAYELVPIFAVCYFLFLKERKMRWLILMGIFGVLMVLTTVRTVLLGVLVAAGYVFVCKKGLRKYAVAVFGLILLYIVFAYTNLFSTVLEKMKYTIQLGSVTSSRGEIWESSLYFYKTGSFMDKLLGQGIQDLMDWNLSNIGIRVQAHNDFLTVLVSFGWVSLVVYLYLLFRFCRGKGGIGCFLCMFVLIWFNGLYSYASFIISLLILKQVFGNINTEHAENNSDGLLLQESDT